MCRTSAQKSKHTRGGMRTFSRICRPRGKPFAQGFAVCCSFVQLTKCIRFGEDIGVQMTGLCVREVENHNCGVVGKLCGLQKEEQCKKLRGEMKDIFVNFLCY